MGYTIINAEMALFPTERGGRSGPIFTGYSPNHKFDADSYYIGLVEVPNNERVFPGEVKAVVIKMLDSPGCKERLTPGYEWEVTEGAEVIGRAKLLSIIRHVDD